METEKAINLDKEIPILNPKQAAFYWDRGVEPKRIYPSISSNTNEPIIIFVFNRDETYALYKEWQDRR